MPITEAETKKFTDRVILRKMISDFAEITEKNPPASWWQLLSDQLSLSLQQFNQENNISSNELNLHIQKTLITLSRLLSWVKPTQPISETAIVSHTEQLIMQFSMKQAKIHEQKNDNEQYLTHFINLEDLVNHPSCRIRKEDKTIEDSNQNQIHITELQIRHPIKDEWHSIPLPKNEKIWHKGGPARAVLNTIADAPLSMQLAEYPWNDFDVITAGNNQHNYHVSTTIGVDPDGIEYMGEKQLNFDRYARGRDTDQNQCCLGSDGLYFTQAAFNAAKTGHISIIGEYIANKAIYGIDKTVIANVTLVKARGLMRLLKNVAENKALSFDNKPVNNNFDVGIYILFLAKKWSKRENFASLLQNLFYLLKQIGQTEATDQSIVDYLERAHQKYSFFDFDREINSKLDLTRWKMKKLGKQFDRETAMLFNLPSGVNLVRKPDDEIPERISLGSFVSDESESEKIISWWPNFLNESRERTTNNPNESMSMYDRLFFLDIERDDTTFDPLIIEPD